jgi:hypothetical protein
MPRVLHPEPFNPVLLTSRALNVSNEQKQYLRNILHLGASDSRFEDKMYAAILLVLTAGSVVPPVVTSLVPNTTVLGSPSFTVHVKGTGFNAQSVIVFAGVEEPTTYVSATELTTGVNMDVWVGPDSVPVAVRNGEVLSDPMSFVFTAPPVV